MSSTCAGGDNVTTPLETAHSNFLHNATAVFPVPDEVSMESFIVTLQQ